MSHQNRNGMTQNLILLVMVPMALIGILMQLRSYPILAFLLFAVNVVALIVRIKNLHDGKTGKIVNAIDYEKLHTKNISQHSRWLKMNIRGHDQTIDQIVRKVQHHLKMARPGRSLGSFLIVGPTGTGKTYLGQLLAEALFPGTEPLVLRMNQYKSPSDVATLFGAPPGTPGAEAGGTLTHPLQDAACRVIVLDELEKAHVDIQHCFYDILDVGTTRDRATGRSISFGGCVFFATCNAGAEELRHYKEKGLDPAAWMGKARDVLMQKAGFDRAFLARWDEIIFMDVLSPMHVAEVACLTVMKHWASYGIEITFTSPELIVELVAKNEEFRDYGVRQLATYIRMKCDNAIASANSQGLKHIILNIDAHGDFVALPGKKAA